MKYKPGDKVRIKSLDWYKTAHKDMDSHVKCGISYFSSAMQEFCGKVMTIEHAYGLHYSMVEDVYGWQWDDEMIEGLAGESQDKMVSLEDVCEFLDEHLYTGTSTDDYDYGREYIYSDFNNATDLIFALRKAMG